MQYIIPVVVHVLLCAIDVIIHISKLIKTLEIKLPTTHPSATQYCMILGSLGVAAVAMETLPAVYCLPRPPVAV